MDSMVFDVQKTMHVFSDGSYTQAVRERIESVPSLPGAFVSWSSLRDEADMTGSADVALMAARAWRALAAILLSVLSGCIGRDFGRIEYMALSRMFREDMERLIATAAEAA